MSAPAVSVTGDAAVWRPVSRLGSGHWWLCATGKGRWEWVRVDWTVPSTDKETGISYLTLVGTSTVRERVQVRYARTHKVRSLASAQAKRCGLNTTGGAR